MIDMMMGKNCAPVPRNHFQGNGSCDAMREANKRADHGMTGMESEIAPYTGVQNLTGSNGNGSSGMNMNTNRPMDENWTGMESEIAPYDGAAAQTAQNQMTQSQMTQAQAAQAQASQQMMQSQMALYGGTESDMIYEGYGTEHDHPVSEEEGMTSIPQDSFNTPLNADEAARNSWRALLARNVGRNVLVRFLMGTQNMVTVEGELYEVGTDYIVIYQPLWDSHITADLYSVKFVEFREPPGITTLA